ncbi:MAG: hypothetical protein IPK87_05825 [Planctomycetes bacterium]|nr:hypothetical protein [Planctomycetota bacterium]
MLIRLVFAAALFALPCAVCATMAVKLDLAALADHSALVVVAKLDSKTAKWDAAKTGIWTHHSLTVSETLKGDHAASREFVTRGGVVGDRGQHVAGSGTFDIGTEYVFFLWKDDDGRFQLTGMVQGAFAVSDDNGVKRAKNSFTGLTIVDATTLKPAVDKAALDYTLAELKKQVAVRVRKGKE